jgi:hypothetical protein
VQPARVRGSGFDNKKAEGVRAPRPEREQGGSGKRSAREDYRDAGTGSHDDEGALWPVAFALKELTATEEANIRALAKKAVS